MLINPLIGIKNPTRKKWNFGGWKSYLFKMLKIKKNVKRTNGIEIKWGCKSPSKKVNEGYSVIV